MKTLSFVNRTELEFLSEGDNGVYPEALALGDCTNDGGQELVFGSPSSEVLLYRRFGKKPSASVRVEGQITCLCIGDVLNCCSNSIVVLTSEGWCYVINCVLGTEAGKDPSVHMTVVHEQHIPPNSKCALLADVDGDGELELAVAFTDRVVQTFRWEEGSGAHTGSINGSMLSDRDTGNSGRLALVGKWLLTGQIGSIAINRGESGATEFLASQPGGTFVYLYMDSVNGPTFKYHPVFTSRIVKSAISTDIVGNISTQGGEKSCVGATTLDGTIMLLDEDKLLWEILVDHQLFRPTKLDLTGDGVDELIVCSWDGKTYIVNQNKQIVKFQFDEPVAAFAAGSYAGVRDETPQPCLVYVTFTNRIYIYHNVRFAQFKSTSLIEELENSSAMEEIQKHVGHDTKMTKEDTRELIRWCLYGNHDNSDEDGNGNDDHSREDVIKASDSDKEVPVVQLEPQS